MKKSLGKQEARKISINFPGDLWKQLKRRALEDDTTVTEILVHLSREYLAKGEKKQGGR